MVIILTFKIKEQLIRIKIHNREIFYSDRMFVNLVRLIPPDQNFIMKIKLSRNKIPTFIQDLFVLTNKEQEEYNNCQTDEDIMDLCIKDIKEKNGGTLVSIQKDG